MIKRLLPPLLFALLSFSLSAQAYFVATPQNQPPLDFSQPVRILVSGRGTDLDTMPQQSALGRAILYKKNFTHQVVLISVFENTRNEASLTKSGWKIILKNDTKLETNSAVEEIKKFKKIRSLEFFGHNSPSLGTQTDGLGFRFDARQPNVAALAPLFDVGAYSIFHGCNSGWLMAQDLSKTWKIAVAGSFTGTRFERLHSNGHFYVYIDAKAPNASWATKNEDLNLSCETGACMRMRPAYSHYDGKWGDFDGPLLNYYKFFCQLDEKECEKRMASSLYGYLAEHSLTSNSSLRDFREVAKEYLCPVYADRKITTDCLNQLDKIERGQGNPELSYVVGAPQLQCTLKSCTGQMTCDDHKCKVNGRIAKGSKTLAEEYLHLMSGFEHLQREGL